MALAASAWVTTEQELKFPVPLAESFFSGFGFALCFVAAAGADITVDAATATPRMLVAAIAPAAMIRRTVWPPRLFTPRRISQRTGSDQGGSARRHWTCAPGAQRANWQAKHGRSPIG